MKGWANHHAPERAITRRTGWVAFWVWFLSLVGGLTVGAAEPQRIWTLGGFPNFCWFAAFTPQGRLVTADLRNLKLWNTNQWALERDLFLSESGFSAVTLSPDGRWIAFGGIIGSPIQWLALESGQLRSVPSSNSVFGLAFAPDSTLLAVAEGQGARLLRVADGAVVREFSADGAAVYGVAFSPDGARLASVTATGLRVWTVATGVLSYAPVAPTSGYRVAFSPDGSRLAVSSDSRIQVLRAADGSLEREYLGHTDFVHSLVWAPDGTNVLSATYDTHAPSAHLWSVLTGELLRTFRASTSAVNSICFSPDGRIVVTAAGGVEAWDAASGERLGEVGAFYGTLLDFALSPDGALLATGTGGYDRRLRLWRVSDGLPLHTWQAQTSHINTVAFAPDGARIATGGKDNYIRLWATNSPVEQLTWLAAGDEVRALAYSPDGAWIASASYEPWVRVWNATNGQPVVELAAGAATNYVSSVAFSPDGSVLAAGCRDAVVRLWNSADWTPAGQLLGHTKGVGPVVFSPDGECLATCAADATVRLWRWREGRELRVLRHHTNSISALAFFAGGRLLLSCSGNQFLVWDTASGQMAGGFVEPMARGVRRVLFTPEGHRFAFARTDSVLTLARAPVVLLGLRPEPSGLAVDWFGPPGTYVLETTSSLDSPWEAATEAFTNSPARLVPTSTPATFVRLRGAAQP